MKSHSIVRCLLPSFIPLFFGAAFAHADNWPQWRGPTLDGISKESNLPTEWSREKNIAWTLPMPGMGGSTPVVWGERIFLTSEDGKDLVLLCVSTQGKELWKRKVGSAVATSGAGRRGGRGGARQAPGGVARLGPGGEGNLASASPSTDGKHVFVFFGTGDFACFDFEGNEIWKFNAEERYGKFDIQHGMHVTPLLHGDRLYLSLLHARGHWVIALDKTTGKEVWKVKRESDAVQECTQSYASPILWHNDKDEYLVVHGNDYATAHRLSDGSEIWRLGDLNPEANYNQTLRFVATPLATPDLIVVPTAKGGPVVGVKPNATGLIRTGGAGEQWRMPRNTPDVPSPLVYEGLVYLCRERGDLICLDASTGKQLYSEKTQNTIHRASPVYADGKIYLTARNGTVTVVKPGPKFTVLATNKLPDDISASPVIANGRIYLRGWKALYAISQDR